MTLIESSQKVLWGFKSFNIFSASRKNPTTLHSHGAPANTYNSVFPSLIFRWSRWWNRLVIVTCCVFCPTLKLATLSSLLTVHIAEPATLCWQSQGQKASHQQVNKKFEEITGDTLVINSRSKKQINRKSANVWKYTHFYLINRKTKCFVNLRTKSFYTFI